jgi:hypothetical protein
MSSAFNLTAQINLRGPTNLKPIIADIKRQLGTVGVNVNVKLDNRAARSIDGVTSKLQAMNTVLTQVNTNASNLNATFSNLSASLSTIKQSSSGVATGVNRVSQSIQQTSKNIKVARTEIEEFGKQSFLAIKRFAAFSIVTSGVFALTNAVTSGFKAFISFNKEIIKLQQVTGKGSIGITSLEKEITRLATSLGVSSESLISVATTLAQAGLSAEDTRIALAALAKTELAPSFDDLASTTEGAIAALRQFSLQTKDLEAALGSINAVAAAFAVESSDIIAAIQRTGGVFASASKGVSQGKDALNEFIAVFTSVRATTRESAETIATGLRTIFTRIQRAKTIEQLKAFGVELQDLEGKFVGPFEAIKRLSEALNQLDPRDIRFATIVEELGGFRQIGKVIPLIQQFATAQQALQVAQKGQSSLTDAQVIAQQSLANQIAKVREQFLALIRDLGKSTVFQGLFKLVLGLTSGLISLASAFKPILPILAIFTAIKGASAITQFAGGFFGSFKKGGGSKAAGENIGQSLTGSKEKERAEATSRAADSIRLNTDALKSLTSSVQGLEATIRSKGPATLASGGKVYGFNKGGMVPGSGRGDKIPALLEPGEVVMNRNAVNKYGAGNLVEMNKSRSTKGIARGARSRLKELSFEEISQLSTEDMIKYAKAQAQDIFTTGGAGIATGSKFISVPKERITPELESSLTTYLGQRGFWKEIVSPIGKPDKSSTKAQSKLSREQALQQQATRMSDEVAARSQQWTSIKSGSTIDNYLLTTLKDPILSDYRTVRNGGSLPKVFHSTRLRKAVNEALDNYDDFDYSSGNIAKLVSNFAAKRFAYGGIVKKFNEGGISKQLQKEMIQAGGYEKFIQQNMLDSNNPDLYNFGLVGLRSGTKSGDNRTEDRKLDNGKKARIHIGFLQSSNDANFKTNIEEDINKSLQKTILKTAGVFGQDIGASINPQTKDQILEGAVLSSAVGSVFESALQMIGAPYIDKIEAIKSMDFPFGLGTSSKLFGDFPNNIPTDATRTIAGSGKGLSDFIGQINRFVSAVDSGKFTDKLEPLPTSQALSAREMANTLVRAAKSNPDNISKINDILQGSAIPGIIRKQNTKRTDSLADNLARNPEIIKKLEDAGFELSYQSSGGLIQKLKLGGFSGGGTVPAMVSNGEAYVPPQLAKKIGYDKLNRMNKADKNGMGRYAGGGISTFKGSGSGTSDSIGPIGLPEGSYVIRAKATKALGLSGGGIVSSIQKLAKGGATEITPEMAERVRNIQQSTTKKYSKQYKQAPNIALSGSNDLTKEQIKLVSQAEYETAAMKDIISNLKLTDKQRQDINKLQEDIANKYREEYKAATDSADKAAIKAKAQIEFTTRARENLFGTNKPQVTPKETLPIINPKVAQENKDYFERRAEKAGMSVSGYKYSLSQQVGEQAYNIRQDQKFAKQEAADSAIGKQRQLKGLGAKSSSDFQKLLGEGAESKEAQQAQAAISEFSANLQKIAPNMDPQEIKAAATSLAESLATTNQSVEEVIAGNEQLSAIFANTISDSEALNEAFKRVSESAGISAETLKANVSSKDIQNQAFIKSKEGQRFGALAEFAPGLTQKFSKTGTGKALGAGADFISGKGGRLSKAFAGAGGFTGIGAGLAVGAESLKQFLPKSVSDPDTAGALGALSGAGTGAAAGAQLGSIAGPIGTLIGGVGGAIIGGIQGFFSAKNTAILTNALEKVAKTSGDLDEAFKKLEADSGQVNFDNAQKAFGSVVSAGADIEAMALGDAASIGGSATSELAIGGAALGAAIGTAILPGVGTAIGGALGYLGGAVTDYSMGVSQTQKDEAIGAMVGGASQNNQAAIRLAETGLGKKSTEELGAIFDSIKNGTNTLNPITEQYVQGALKAAEAANGTKQLTAAETESISVQAQQRAALDAYMKKRKESGATDEQIAKEISKNSAAARKEGEEALRVQAELTTKQALLARATKEVAIASENLFDVYRRISAQAERYGNELDQFGTDLDNMIAGLGGDTSMRGVNRQNEQVLGNVSAYSIDEVRNAANATAGMLGGTPEAQNLANQAVAQKVVQDQIPALLRSAGGGAEEQDNAIALVREQLASQGLSGDAVESVLTDLKNELAKGQGLSEAELGDVVNKAFAATGKGLETLQNVTKKYNDTLQKAKDFQEKYNKAILEANSYLRKANQVRLNAEIDLAKTLGKSVSLEQLNKPFDAEISSLTSGLVNTGDLQAGAANDPAAIAAAISAAQQRNTELDKQSPEILAAGAGLAENDPLRGELNQAQLDNIKAIGENNVAINEGRQALEKLASDGSKAANALSKIQEQQQKVESLAGRLEKVFTASPEELFKMNRQSDALALAQTAGAEQFKSRRFRQDAFAGLEQDKEFLTQEEYGKQRANLLRKSLEAQGLTGSSKINKGGIDMTVDEFLKRVEGGPGEDDPNVKAYREAVATQVAANEALADLNLQQAEAIQLAMLGLEEFLSTKFPEILTKAVTDAKADSETKPQTGSKPKDKEPTQTQKDLAQAEAKAKEKAEAETKAKEKAKKAKETASGPAQMMEAKRLENEAKDATRARVAADAEVTGLKEKNTIEQAEAKKEEEAANQQAAAKAVAETQARQAEAQANASSTVTRTRETRETNERQRAANEQTFGSLRPQTTATSSTTIPAPLPPGSQNAATPNKFDLMKQANSDFLKARSKIQAFNQGIQGSPEDIKAYKEAKAKLEKAKENIRISTQNDTASAPSPSGAPSKEKAAMFKKMMEAQGVVNPNSPLAQKAAIALKELDAQTQSGPQALSKQEKANLASLARIPKEERNEDQQARYTALANRNAATNPVIQAKQKAEAIKNQEQIAQAQAANFTTPVQFNDQALTLGQVDAGAATPAQTQAIAQAKAEAGALPIGTQIPQGGMASEDTRRRFHSSNPQQYSVYGPQPSANEVDQGRIRITSAPVPVTRPTVAQGLPSTPTGQTTPPSQSMSATSITLDPAALEGLNTFNTNFASYVDKLVTFEFPTIPDKIEMVGNHTVDVRITGAAAFEGLDKRFQEMINKAVDAKMGDIWQQTGGALGSSPGKSKQ